MQSKEIRLEQVIDLIEEKLADGKSVRFMPRGISMLPMLRQGKDSVVLSPLTGRLKKYDLPLYRRDDGKFILHRGVKAGDTYTCIGDNQFHFEHGVRHEQMIAVVTSFIRDGNEISVDAPRYRIYCRVWHWVRPFRHIWSRGKNFLRRIVKRLR